MPSTLYQLTKKGLAHPPTFLPEAIQYEVYIGSSAYGASSETSDMDIISFAIPDKHLIFPNLAGYIPGFGTKPQGFEHYQEHHIMDKDALGGAGREYDYTAYSIVKYFDLCMDGNPSMIGSLFVPERCILHLTPIGQKVLTHRKMFLNKSCYPRYRGYAHQMLHKIRHKDPSASSKRRALIDKFGWDTKYGMNLVRLLLECEMILREHDLDIEANKEVLKAIRRGDWTVDEVEKFFKEKLPALDILEAKSSIPAKPDEQAIKQLLLDCLEQHFGTLKDAITVIDPAIRTIRDIEQLITRYHQEIKGHDSRTT